MRILIFGLLTFAISGLSYGQVNPDGQVTDKLYIEKGDYYFDNLEYKKAIVFYNMAYRANENNYHSILRKADVYEKLNLYTQAEACYRYVFESTTKIDNLYRLKYALALLINNKSTESKKWFLEYNHYIEEEIKGVNYISATESRVKLYKDSTISIVSHPEEINSKESDVCPYLRNNALIFSSDRNAANGYDLFQLTDPENAKSNKIKAFNSSLNSVMNEKAIAINADGSELYLSRGEETGMSIYQTTFPVSSNQTLRPSELVIEGFNSDIAYPTFNSRGTIMYFISKAPGGQGGSDIYISRRIDTKWTTPENVGAVINTSGDESYPYVYNDSMLFFASTGHAGYGGMDIYSVNLKFADKKVINLGNQVNSSSDDFAYFLSSEGQTAYFSSNRPGGKGKEDIYRADLLSFKVKYAYRPRRRSTVEEGKINLIFSNAKEYNIAPEASGEYTFTFAPEVGYKIVIQREDVEASEILNNPDLTEAQRQKSFLNPPPIQRAEVYVPPGLKHVFSAGREEISDQYLQSLNDMATAYQSPNENPINLTALAKELEFSEGEVYTIEFVKDDSKISTYKPKGETSLQINDEDVNLYGESFLFVLPLDKESTFNIQTDIKSITDNYSAKKHAVFVDKGAVFTDEVSEEQDWMIAVSVNTDSIDEVKPINRLVAKEISIIPGTEYILTLSKEDAFTGDDVEIIVPLTRGVKYDLSSTPNETGEFADALADFLSGREDIVPATGELIDISLLSKELDVKPGEQVSFNLLPVKSVRPQNNTSEAKTSLRLDGENMMISKTEKYAINVPFNLTGSVNIQTDIEYVKDNFKPNSIKLSVDTLDFFSEILVDTTGYGAMVASGYLVSMSVNTESNDEVEVQNQLSAKEVSILPAKEYILTVKKIDGVTGEKNEIFVPLTRDVKYDFTTNPLAEEAYREKLDRFLEGREDIQNIDGEMIDISLLSKELQIREGDEVSFTLLPVRSLNPKPKSDDDDAKSSLYLDDEVVEFTHIQKYTINVPLEDGQVNIHTDIDHLEQNYDPQSYILEVDMSSFFSEIVVDTTGYGDRVIREITDPVFDVVTINFDLNKDVLRKDATSTLQKSVIDQLKGDNRLYVTIKGFTDGLGNADYNLKLSRQRSESVKEFLLKNGIGDSRIRTFSYGVSKTLSEGVKWEDLSEDELEKYRKVEIIIYLPE